MNLSKSFALKNNKLQDEFAEKVKDKLNHQTDVLIQKNKDKINNLIHELTHERERWIASNPSPNYDKKQKKLEGDKE